MRRTIARKLICLCEANIDAKSMTLSELEQEIDKFHTSKQATKVNLKNFYTIQFLHQTCIRSSMICAKIVLLEELAENTENKYDIERKEKNIAYIKLEKLASLTSKKVTAECNHLLHKKSELKHQLKETYSCLSKAHAQLEDALVTVHEDRSLRKQVSEESVLLEEHSNEAMN